MAEPRYGSILACIARASILTGSGVPDDGTDHAYVTSTLLEFTTDSELSDDVDVEKKNGCGDVCQSFFKQGTLKRVTLDSSFCELDIQMAHIMAGASMLASAGVPLGMQWPKSGDGPPPAVCLELWTMAWDGVVQATPAALGGEPAWWHWVFPNAKFKIGSVNPTGDDFIEFPLTGFSVENPNMPTGGPFDDWPAYVQAAGGVSAAAAVFLDTFTPTDTGDFQDIPAVAS